MQGFCQFVNYLVTWVTISSEETLKVVVADVSACSDAGLLHARGFYIFCKKLSKLPHNVVPLYPSLSLKSLTTCISQRCLHSKNNSINTRILSIEKMTYLSAFLLTLEHKTKYSMHKYRC